MKDKYGKREIERREDRKASELETNPPRVYHDRCTNDMTAAYKRKKKIHVK